MLPAYNEESFIEDVINNGTEADQQIYEFEKNGMKGLMSYLMETVDYDYKENV